ncbi:MAG: outer membrane beta-barrel protein [Gammaproteobacteria bacterium]|nr:outer membrane beta-barrel protein [Gammaproteobacteria bacterium]MDH3536609.1 outer membrane beta-barrel protein [Gammaproteobacteria bacterium]
METKIQPQRGETVADRQRPEQQQLGIPWGGFYVFPEFEYSEYLNDNIFAVESNTQSDRISVFAPGVTLTSNWTRHRLDVSFSGELGRYRDLFTEDYDDIQFSSGAKVDLVKQSFISLGVSFADLHESRDSLDDAGGLNPTKYRLSNAFVNLTYKPGRFSLAPTLSLNEYDFDDVKAVQFGQNVVIDQDDRDRSGYVLDLEVAYEIGVQEVFLRLSQFETEYDRLQNFSLFDRSSKGNETGMGVVLDLGGITSSRLYYGYRNQRFDQPLPDIDTPVYELRFTWNVSTLTTLELGAGRSTLETNSLVYSGYLSSLWSFRLDHEIRRNLILNFEYSRIDDRYEGIGSASRDDQTDSSGIGLKWIFNRFSEVMFRYEHTNRQSNDNSIPRGFEDGDFSNDAVWARIGLRI